LTQTVDFTVFKCNEKAIFSYTIAYVKISYFRLTVILFSKARFYDTSDLSDLSDLFRAIHSTL